MRKLFALMLVMAIMASTLQAQAPELKNMMPNSWQKLSRLEAEEEKEFLAQQKVNSDIEQFKSDSWGSPEYVIQERRVYKETVNNIDFYRVLVCNQNMIDFLESTYHDKTFSIESYENFIYHRVQQTVYAKDKSKGLYKIRALEYKVYGSTTDSWEYFLFNDLFIKPLNEKEIGFFITETGVSFTVDRTRWEEGVVSIKYYTCKDQVGGSNSTEFLRVNIQEDLAAAFSDSDKYIRIAASSYLFDPQSPLKYSIQNAFDGNPATSYVENTEDDLMKLSFPGYGNEYLGSFTISLINGYASNENLYLKNNRVKKIDIVGYQLNDSKTELIERNPKIVEFKDRKLNYQLSCIDFLCFGPFYFKISGIYHGSSFNDTCIAEINFFDDINKNWLFGEIDE